MSHLGFFEVWLNQGVGDVKLFLTILRQRLKDQFIQGWAGEIQNFQKHVLSSPEPKAHLVSL